MVDEVEADVVIAGDAVPVQGPELGWEPGPELGWEPGPELDPPPVALRVDSEKEPDEVHAAGVSVREKSCAHFCSLLFCFFFSFLGMLGVGELN